MDKLGQIIDWTLSAYGFWGIILTAAAILLLAVQLWFHMRLYRITGKGKKPPGASGERAGEGISVIVLLGDDLWYLDHTLPKILGQEYARFEVVVVEVGSTEEFSDHLAMLREQYPRLTTTHVDYDPRFPISNKIAYNIGIKAARYDNIILTTSDAYPVSPKWLAHMAGGFERGEVVISYCGLEKKPGLGASLARSSRFYSGLRYLSAALRGKPYRGIIQNLGFTRRAYFTNRGFDYLNMNLGEDDLFIQRLTRDTPAAVVADPHSTLRQKQWGGCSWWWDRRKFYDTATRFYPSGVKLGAAAEVFSRLMFYGVVVAMMVILPLELKIAAGVLFIARMLLVRLSQWKARRRLGEGGLGNAGMIYDLYYPLARLWLSVMGRIRPAPGVWR